LENANLNVYKVTLGTGKVVLLRELKIKHQEMAVMAASPRANGDQILLQLLAQKELLKQVVVKIDDRPVKPIELEDLDSLFTLGEYSQLNQVLGKISGGNTGPLGKPEFQIELVPSGE
jgi:hypothetical protein